MTTTNRSMLFNYLYRFGIETWHSCKYYCQAIVTIDGVWIRNWISDRTENTASNSSAIVACATVAAIT
jgi:hypothetical protein